MSAQQATAWIVWVGGLLLGHLAVSAVAADAGCAESARMLRYACEYEVRAEFREATAPCLDNSTTKDACMADAEAAHDDARAECDETLQARLDLCEQLDDAAHDAAFGPDFAANFVDPHQIGGTVAPNPYFPLVAGNKWVYESGDQTITVTVTDATKLIQGITCVTVNDVVEENGVVVEDTDDWHAQDADGNVWYCGEESKSYRTFDGDAPAQPELVDIEGSWKAGRDRAEAGVLIPAAPQTGTVIRQELSYTQAEDAIEIVSVTASESAPGGSCDGNCLQTRDFTPLEPGVEESKFYAPGIGLIVETEGEDRIELVDFQEGGQ
jgi:hypothetical protein